MTNDDSIARRIEWRLLEQSLSKCWVLIGLNVVLALLFAAVYLSSGRDPNLVLLVLTPPAGRIGHRPWRHVLADPRGRRLAPRASR